MTGDRDKQPSSPHINHKNRYISAIIDIAENLEKYLIYIFYLFLLFVVVAEVFRRYVLSMSSFWSGEVARYSFLYITYIGISLAAYKRTHIRIDILMNRASQRVENYLYLFGNIVMLIFGMYAIYYTIPLIQTSIEFQAKTQALSINRAFAQFAIPFGFTLMIIRILQRTYYDIRDIRAGDPVFKGENIFIDEKDEGEEW